MHKTLSDITFPTTPFQAGRKIIEMNFDLKEFYTYYPEYKE